MSKEVVQGHLDENRELGLRELELEGDYGNKFHPGTGWLSYHDYDEKGEYIANIQSKRYHLPNCKQLKKQSTKKYNLLRTQNRKNRYKPCRYCQKEEYEKRQTPEWWEEYQHQKYNKRCNEGEKYVQNPRSNVIHYANCYHTYQMISTPENVLDPRGHTGCQHCQPPTNKPSISQNSEKTETTLKKDTNKPINKKEENREFYNKSKHEKTIILRDKVEEIFEFNEKEYKELINEIEEDIRLEKKKKVLEAIEWELEEAY